MTDQTLREEYMNRYYSLEKLKVVVEQVSLRVLRQQKINCKSVHGRVKDFDSFQEKIRTKGFRDPFNEVKDLVGVRLVCLFRPEVEKAATAIKDTFTILDEDNQMEGKSDNFGYMAFHLTAQLKDSQVDSGLEAVKSIPFEIQIRTIAQDAWASISHHLDYKKEESAIPARLRRDFHALSGLFYVADVHFALLTEEKAKGIGDDL